MGSSTSELIDCESVAVIFGVKPATARRWARMGLIKSLVTPGGVYRFERSEIARELERRCMEAKSSAVIA